MSWVRFVSVDSHSEKFFYVKDEDIDYVEIYENHDHYRREKKACSGKRDGVSRRFVQSMEAEDEKEQEFFDTGLVLHHEDDEPVVVVSWGPLIRHSVVHPEYADEFIERIKPSKKRGRK